MIDTAAIIQHNKAVIKAEATLLALRNKSLDFNNGDTQPTAEVIAKLTPAIQDVYNYLFVYLGQRIGKQMKANATKKANGKKETPVVKKVTYWQRGDAARCEALVLVAWPEIEAVEGRPQRINTALDILASMGLVVRSMQTDCGAYNGNTYTVAGLAKALEPAAKVTPKNEPTFVNPFSG